MTYEKEKLISRRDFIKAAAGLSAASIFSVFFEFFSKKASASEGEIPKRPLGKTGVNVTILGLGGEGILRTWGRSSEATKVIKHALDRGITYCDTAPAYSASQDYYGEVLSAYRDRIFLASKTHERGRDGSLRLLEQSLKRLNTDHLDLWQLHDLRDKRDIDEIFGPDGAIEAVEEAKKQGMIKYAGITGHHDPAILNTAINRYPFDTVLLAANAADRSRLSFIDQTIPEASKKQMGIIAMKVFARGALLSSQAKTSPKEALGYVLSLPVSTAIIGFSNTDEVDESVRIARSFIAYSENEMQKIEDKVLPISHQLNWFKKA